MAVESRNENQTTYESEQEIDAIQVAKALSEVATAAKSHKPGNYTLGLTVKEDGHVVFRVRKDGWF